MEVKEHKTFYHSKTDRVLVTHHFEIDGSISIHRAEYALYVPPETARKLAIDILKITNRRKANYPPELHRRLKW